MSLDEEDRLAGRSACERCSNYSKCVEEGHIRYKKGESKKGGAPMNSVVIRKKRTLFGKIIQKIESELKPDKSKLISPDVPIDNTNVNEDTAAIQARRDELKTAMPDSSDDIIIE